MSSNFPDPNELMALEREACRLMQAGGIDEMVDRIIAPDGLLFADGGGIVSGKEAQRALFKQFLGAGYAMEFAPTAAFVSRSADMAWVHGPWHLCIENPGGCQGRWQVHLHLGEGRQW